MLILQKYPLHPSFRFWRLPVEIKHKLWLERDGRVIFGPGRDGLLKAIEECHSLNAAAKKLKMSYRAAWGRIKASEERLGIKLVEMDSVKHGMHLTDEAKELMNCFDQLERDIARLLNKANGKLPLKRS
jgi:molybdate transport system regulatory protein